MSWVERHELAWRRTGSQRRYRPTCVPIIGSFDFQGPVMSAKGENEFEKLGADEADVGFFAELWDFLRHNKKWWLLPILVTFLLFAVFLMLAHSAAAPFIYTLF
jgi:Family of unknown function (DUF5989)